MQLVVQVLVHRVDSDLHTVLNNIPFLPVSLRSIALELCRPPTGSAWVFWGGCGGVWVGTGCKNYIKAQTIAVIRGNYINSIKMIAISRPF